MGIADLSWLADVLAGLCLVVGASLSLVAGVGLVRFPDVLSRLHTATKPQVLGLLLILVGVGLRLRVPGDLTLLLLVGVFQLMTAPVAAQIVGRAAYRSGRYRPELLIIDEMTETSGGPAGTPPPGGTAEPDAFPGAEPDGPG